MAVNELVLNYHDAVLYQSDLAFLESNNAWLNDACMNFYLTVLQQRNNPIKVKFMDPAVVSFLMHQCDHDDWIEFATSFTTPTEKLIIPINNAHAPSSAWQTHGSHWSLLVMSPNEKQEMWHFDSVSSANQVAAKAVMERFQCLFDLTSNNLHLREIVTPQQQNGYDCGLHALCAAEVVAYCKTLQDAELMLNERVIPGFGNDMRLRVFHEAKQRIQKFQRNH